MATTTTTIQINTAPRSTQQIQQQQPTQTMLAIAVGTATMEDPTTGQVTAGAPAAAAIDLPSVMPNWAQSLTQHETIVSDAINRLVNHLRMIQEMSGQKMQQMGPLVLDANNLAESHKLMLTNYEEMISGFKKCMTICNRNVKAIQRILPGTQAQQANCPEEVERTIDDVISKAMDPSMDDFMLAIESPDTPSCMGGPLSVAVSTPGSCDTTTKPGGKRLTTKVKIQIVNQLAQGVTINQIRREFGIKDRRTISNIWRKWSLAGNVDNLSSSGRPTQVSAADRERLAHFLRAHSSRELTLDEIRSECGLEYSRATVRRLLMDIKKEDIGSGGSHTRPRSAPPSRTSGQQSKVTQRLSQAQVNLQHYNHVMLQ